MEFDVGRSDKTFQSIDSRAVPGGVSVESNGGSKVRQSCPTEFCPLPRSYKANQEHEVIFSTQRSQMDFLTWKGVENRTGVEKPNAYKFILKELLDNAVDFLDPHNDIATAQPEIHVCIQEELPATTISCSGAQF